MEEEEEEEDEEEDEEDEGLTLRWRCGGTEGAFSSRATFS